MARHFPVCSTSDEFHFFPQLSSSVIDWSLWDDFSSGSVEQTTAAFGQWLRDLDGCDLAAETPADRIDIEMLKRVMSTLSEQLDLVAPQASQPTFYLTVLAIGLDEARQAGAPALQSRGEGVPEFLGAACRNLNAMPELFRDMGVDMARRLKSWLLRNGENGSWTAAASAALDTFEACLRRAAVSDRLLLPSDLYQRVAQRHMGCDMPIDEIAWHLDCEIREATDLLRRSAAELDPGSSWQEVLARQPCPAIPSGGAARFFENLIDELAGHCLQHGFFQCDLPSDFPVSVKGVPDFYSPVRGNAAYSLAATDPPSGGTFFFANRAIPADVRLLTAHETYPGHHLLDTHRWNSKRPVRRHIEFPIFYEGWASFSEELLFDTGFFSGPLDTLMIGKRRFWRAVRGRLDLALQTGERDIDGAIEHLVDLGRDPGPAEAMVKRYLLKPGYQLSYTIGRHRFRTLYRKYEDASDFVRTLMAAGEIGFDHL